MLISSYTKTRNRDHLSVTKLNWIGPKNGFKYLFKSVYEVPDTYTVMELVTDILEVSIRMNAYPLKLQLIEVQNLILQHNREHYTWANHRNQESLIIHNNIIGNMYEYVSIGEKRLGMNKAKNFNGFTNHLRQEESPHPEAFLMMVPLS